QGLLKGSEIAGGGGVEGVTDSIRLGLAGPRREWKYRKPSASKEKRETCDGSSAVGGVFAITVILRCDDLALGAELSGAGACHLADAEREIVQCNFGARDGGFSDDSALAAGGGDPV